MMRRLAAIATWLLLGNALAAGLFWVLLQVPESSTLTLALSALAVVAIAIVLLWVQGGALAAWRPEQAVGVAFRRGLARSGAVIAGALVFGAMWWLTEVASRGHMNHAGQIDAWIIARSGHSETGVLHQAILGAIWVVRWGLGVTMAASLAATIVARGAGAIGHRHWLSRALNPIRWVAVALIVALAIMWPWKYVYWRPATIPLSAEPWFVAVKLGGIAVLWSVVAALVLRIVTPPSAPIATPTSPTAGPAPPPRAA